MFDIRISPDIVDHYLNSPHRNNTYEIQDFLGPKYKIYDIGLKPEIIDWCNSNNIIYGFRYEFSYTTYLNSDEEERYFIILENQDDALHFQLTWG